MLHLIELVKLHGFEPFAYHYASLNIKSIKDVHDKLFKKFSNYEISTHILNTNDKSWPSVVNEDPYFEDVKCVENTKDFEELLSNRASMSSSDICSYILNYFGSGINNKKMEKLLYFCYSNFLEKYNKQLFPEHFCAWKYGPVESKSRHKRIDNNLPMVDIVIDKLLFSNYSNEMLSSISEVFNLYGNKSKDELIELTHRDGSPWQRNYKENLNNNISDDDILKYHYVERINN